jgi:hypothetical protein
MTGEDPAFPALKWEGNDTEQIANFPGMTLRYYFAVKAMQALIANGHIPTNKMDVADVAIAYADALLERLKK